MLIKNVKLTDKNKLVDIRIENGIFKEIKKNLEAYKDEKIIDGKGNLALHLL